MTPEQQRIAIAEACGIATWKGDCPDKSLTEKGLSLPDYLNDLNAMREAFLTLHPTDRARWAHELKGIIANTGLENKDIDGEPFLDSFANATASQRAEAFLRVLGKFQ